VLDDFENKLKQKHPEFSEKEIKELCILISTLYNKISPEIRTDPSAASDAAKKSVKPQVLNKEEREYLNTLPDLKLIEVDAITYLKVPKRKMGEFTLRIVYNKNIIADVIKKIGDEKC